MSFQKLSDSVVEKNDLHERPYSIDSATQSISNLLTITLNWVIGVKCNNWLNYKINHNMYASSISWNNGNVLPSFAKIHKRVMTPCCGARLKSIECLTIFLTSHFFFRNRSAVGHSRASSSIAKSPFCGCTMARDGRGMTYIAFPVYCLENRPAAPKWFDGRPIIFNMITLQWASKRLCSS